MAKFLTLMVLASMLIPGVAAAQGGDDPTPTPTPDPGWPLRVTVPATDGLPLAGDFYVIGPAQPTVLLLHQLYTDRTSWALLLPPLLEAGYNVLAVDVRGHGLTGGGIDWPQAVRDVQTWLDWLRLEAGVPPDAIALIGSSMGSSLALVGCANDPACRTAIALSPGWNYYDVSVRAAFQADFGQRPVLLVYTARDAWPRRGVPRMVEAATNPVTVQRYAGNAHGIDMLWNEGETLIPLMLDWLAAPGVPGPVESINNS